MGSRSLLFLASLWESLKMALDAMRAHKMRAFLTLIGVVIGVTTIIGMMTVLGGIKNSIDTNMRNALSVNVFQVQQHDQDMGFHMGPRHRENRPPIEAGYADAIRERAPSVRRVGVEDWTFGIILRRGALESNARQNVAGGSVEFGDNNGYFVAQGRPLTEQDAQAARHVVVISDEVKRSLFEGMNPIGETVRVGAEKFEVVGVFEARGAMLGESRDNINWIPLPTFYRMFGKRNEWNNRPRSVNLTVQAWSPETLRRRAAGSDRGAARRARPEARPAQQLRDVDAGHAAGFVQPDDRLGRLCRLRHHRDFAAGGRHRHHEHHARIGHRAHARDRIAQGARRHQALDPAPVPDRIGDAVRGRRRDRHLPRLRRGRRSSTPSCKYPAPVPIGAVLLAIIFCSLVGVGFGMWPAIRAARLDPIEALRHE